MGFALIGRCDPAGNAGSTSALYSSISGGNGAGTSAANEAQVQIVARVAGTLSNFTVYANAIGTGRVARVRKNTANGNQVINLTDITAGVYTDAVNTDALAAADKFNLSTIESVGATTWYWENALFKATSGHACYYVAGGSNTSLGTGAGGDSNPAFLHLSGMLFESATEAGIQVKARVGGTLQNFQVYVTSNAAADVDTFATRINGVNGTCAISVGAGLSGLFEDTTHTDAFNPGDLLNYVHFAGVDGGAYPQISFIGCCSVSASSPQNDIFSTGGGAGGAGLVRAASATKHYLPVIGAMPATLLTTENNTTAVRHQFPCQTSKLRIYISANTYAASATLQLRKNLTTSLNQVVTITAGVTGFFEDTTHTDTLAAGDDIACSITGGTSGSITIRSIGLLEQDMTAATTAALVARSALMAKARGAAAGTLPIQGQSIATASLRPKVIGGNFTLALTGRANAQVEMRGLPAGLLALAGRTKSRNQARAGPAGALPLSGRATSAVKSRVTPAGSAPLSGRTSLATKATSAAASVLGLASRAVAALAMRAGATGVLPLTGRATGQGKARTAPGGSVGVSARAMATAAARAALSGVAVLSARGKAQATAAGAPTGLLALSGRAVAAVRTAAGATVALLLAGKMAPAVKAGGATTGQLALAGRTMAASALQGTITGGAQLAALVGRAGAQAKARAGMALTVGLSARATMQARATAGLQTIANLAGRISMATAARATESLAGNLSGAIKAKVASAGAIAGTIGLSARAKAMSTASGGLTVVANMVAFAGRIGAAVSARASSLTLTFRLNPNIIALARPRRRAATAERRQLVATARPRRRVVTWRGNNPMAFTNVLEPPIDAAVENETVTFDYGPALTPGIMLTGVPVVTVSVLMMQSGAAADSNPQSRVLLAPQFAASPATGAPTAAVLVLFGQAVAGVVYLIQCSCPTTDGQNLSLYTHFQAKQPD